MRLASAEGWSKRGDLVIRGRRRLSAYAKIFFGMIIDAQTLKVLQNIEAFGHANDAQETDRARRMLNLERNTAELIQILVLSSGRQRVLEIGTSNGYSALWLGAALRAIPGAQSLVTIERDAGKVQQARSNIALAGLSGMITVQEGSATEIIREIDCL